MSICQQERYQVQQQAQQQIQQASTTYLQHCETFSDQIDNWVQGWSNQCNQVQVQSCQNWPWPFNYLCKWVTQLVCALVQALVELVSTIIRVVCQTVVHLVSALASLLATLIIPIIVLGCALFGSTRVAIAGGSDLPKLGGSNFDQGPGDDRDAKQPFLWGVSTAGQQVEGNDLMSDWQFFVNDNACTTRALYIAKLGNEVMKFTDPGRGIDHTDFRTFHADVLRAKALGCNCYRLSIEWARVQPAKPGWIDAALAANIVDPNQIYRGTPALSASADTLMAMASDAANFDAGGLKLYQVMIQCLRDEGMTPVVTLNHMSLPLWVCTPPVEELYSPIANSGNPNDKAFKASLGGWEAPMTAAAYEAYVQFVINQLTDVSHIIWVTVNEPVGSVVEVGYIVGVWPPGFLAQTNRALKAIHNLIAAHVAVYNAIKALAPTAMVGFSHAVGESVPASQWGIAKLFGDNVAACNQWHYAHITYFLNAVTKGEYNPTIWRKDTPMVRNDWMNKLDFVAPQYYRRFDIYHSAWVAPSVPFIGGQPVSDNTLKTISLLSDMNWPVAPAGLHDLLMEFHNSYGLPILITENGMGECRDRNRAAYIVAHLQQVLQAIQDGAQIIGYIHWTIADNWEWAYDYLPKARFGLFSIDRTEDLSKSTTGSFTRHLTEGALALCYTIRNSQLVRDTNSSTDPMDLPARSFGAYTPDGNSITTPGFAPGTWWFGTSKSLISKDSESLNLHLATLFDGSLFGLIHLKEQDLLFPLTNIVWTPDANPALAKIGAGTLTFSHQQNMDTDDEVAYSFALNGGTEEGHQDLKGTRTVKGVEWEASLTWQPKDGTWLSADPNDEIQAVMPRQFGLLNQTNGPKYLRTLRGWEPQVLDETPQDDGLFVTLASFEMSGETATVQVTEPSGVTRQWSGGRLQDGIPF